MFAMFPASLWRITGSPARKLILLAVAAAGEPVTAAELAPLAEMPPGRVAALLDELSAAGAVTADTTGRYRPAEAPVALFDRTLDHDPHPDGRPLPDGVFGVAAGHHRALWAGTA